MQETPQDQSQEAQERLDQNDEAKKSPEPAEAQESSKETGKDPCSHGEGKCTCGHHGESMMDPGTDPKKPEPPPPLSRKDIRHIMTSGYGQAHSKFKKSFVIRNKKNGKVVELRAASSVHACTMVGWRPRQVEVVAVMDVGEPGEVKKDGEQGHTDEAGATGAAAPASPADPGQPVPPV